MPESAECTTTGRRPSAMRSRRTWAMLCQFETDDTLVPPNLSTTQGALKGINRLRKCRAALFPTAARPRRLPPGSRRLCRACRREPLLGPPLGALQQGIEVMGFFGFAQELIVNIKMFVFAFTHFSRKALEINGIEQADT